MSSAAPWDVGDALALSSIREALIRQEDTIIFALIERAQYTRNLESHDENSKVYAALTGGTGTSMLQFMLLEQERSHARIRRYTSPDEHAYFPDRLPAPMLPLIDFPEVLHPNLVNLNSTIMDIYLNKVLPGLCRKGDDGQHGSSVVADIAVLQAISKRVHYGFFVAESKFLGQRAEFTKLIEEEDEDGIMALLTHAAVEEKVIRRVRLKASTFGQEITEAPPAPPASSGATNVVASSSQLRIDPDLIAKLYFEQVIPLTKVAELQYLMQRLTPASVAHHGGADSASARAAQAFIGSTAPAGKPAAKLVRCPNAADVFEAVSSNKAAHGVALLEQGDSGILPVMRELLMDNSLRIVGELLHETRFRLVSRGGVLADVSKVVARADVLRICRSWMKKLLVSSVELEETTATDLSKLPVSSPTGKATRSGGKRSASAMEAGGEATVAYIVEVHVPLDNGMQVLATAPEDVVELARCVVLAKPVAAPKPTGRDRTILSLSLNEEAGSLALALDAIHRHGVNLLNIRSYVRDVANARKADVIVTAEGHELDSNLASAIEELSGLAAQVKVFGSFKSAEKAVARPYSP